MGSQKPTSHLKESLKVHNNRFNSFTDLEEKFGCEHHTTLSSSQKQKETSMRS